MALLHFASDPHGPQARRRIHHARPCGPNREAGVRRDPKRRRIQTFERGFWRSVASWSSGWTIQLDRETLPSAIQSGGRARRDRASHDWREADRDPAQRVRRHQWSRSNIDHSVDTALSLSAPRSSRAKAGRALQSARCGFGRVRSSPNPYATLIGGWTTSLWIPIRPSR